MRKTKRTTRDEWLAEALRVLEEGGVGAVRVDRLAKTLGTSRSGFYWHFRDRAELLTAMLDYWSGEYTGIVTGDPRVAALPARERLVRIVEMIADRDLGRYEIAMRSWAAYDSDVERAVRRVYGDRLDFVRKTFRELGFRDADLDMRARLFVVYHTWVGVMFGDVTSNERARCNEAELDLLTRRSDDDGNS